MKDLSLAPQAPWRQRYRAPKILWAQLASQNPANGLVCTDRDGIFQLYAWDTITGDLQCLTDAPAGIVEGVISADGHWVYYHLDQQGNEIGHFVRIPFDGGSEESLTPQMPLYSSFGLQQSFNGVVLGFTRAHEGFTVIVLANGEEPREIYTSKHITFGPVLSAKGEIAVVASTEHSGTMDFELLAYEVSSGKQIASLTDGEDTSITPGSFSPVVGDLRMLASTSKSGFDRPLIWNPATNERFDLPLADLEGEIIPWDWSPDGERVLLC